VATKETNTMLESLEISSAEAKRESGLAILSSVSHFNPRLLTDELLAKLNLRLVDSSMKVRINAASAIRRKVFTFGGQGSQSGKPG
jgi:hypothetical protein